MDRLVERISRNLGENRLTGAVYLDVDKAFDTLWIYVLSYKLKFLNFSSYIVRTISYYHRCRTFDMSFQAATSFRRGIRTGVAQGGLICRVFFSLYVKHMP